MDIETLHKDICNSLSSDPLPSVILKTQILTLNGNLTTMVYSSAIIESTYQMLMIYASKSYGTSRITYYQDTTVRTRLSSKSNKNMSGWNSNPLSSTFVTLVSSASIQKLHVTILMGYSDHFLFWNVCGIQSPWISLNNSLPLMGLLLSSLL